MVWTKTLIWFASFKATISNLIKFSSILATALIKENFPRFFIYSSWKMRAKPKSFSSSVSWTSLTAAEFQAMIIQKKNRITGLWTGGLLCN